MDTQVEEAAWKLKVHDNISLSKSACSVVYTCSIDFIV